MDRESMCHCVYTCVFWGGVFVVTTPILGVSCAVWVYQHGTFSSVVLSNIASAGKYGKKKKKINKNSRSSRKLRERDLGWPLFSENERISDFVSGEFCFISCLGK